MIIIADYPMGDTSTAYASCMDEATTADPYPYYYFDEPYQVTEVVEIVDDEKISLPPFMVEKIKPVLAVNYAMPVPEG